MDSTHKALVRRILKEQREEAERQKLESLELDEMFSEKELGQLFDEILSDLEINCPDPKTTPNDNERTAIADDLLELFDGEPEQS